MTFAIKKTLKDSAFYINYQGLIYPFKALIFWVSSGIIWNASPTTP